MADPDEALIEAIAEASGTALIEHGSCAATNPLHPRSRMCACGEVLSSWNEWARHKLDATARAAYAAMVAHLGLVEETSGIGVPVRRLVSRWVEVDHGSE